MKKGFVLLLALCLLGLLGWAFAEETVDVGDCTYAIADGEAKLTAINGDYTYDDLVIPESVELDGTAYPVTAIGGNVYSKWVIQSLSLPDTIKTIENEAFKYKKFHLLRWPASLEYVGDSAFQYYDSMVDHRLPALPDSVRHIGRYGFYGSRFESISALPASLTYIGDYAFGYCNMAFDITLPDDLEYLGAGAFYHNELTGITVPDTITAIKPYTFYYAKHLTSARLPDSVTEIGEHAFEFTTALKSLDIPDSLTTIGACAFGYSGLEEVDLPVVYNSNGVGWVPTTLGNSAFYNCKSLREVLLPNTLTDIPANAFQNCAKLVHVKVPSGGLESLGQYAFTGCTSLKYIMLTNYSTTIGTGALPAGITVIVDSGESYDKPAAYCKANGIPTIKLNEIGWEVIDESAWTCAFTSYTGTDETFTLPDWMNGRTFVRVENSAFSGNTTLKSVVLPDTITQIGESAFLNCTALESVNIPGGVTSIGSGAFSGCASLKSAAIPEGVTSIGENMFYNCSALESLSLPGGVTAIGSQAFRNCAALKDIELPSGLQSIGAYAFDGCAGLTQLGFNDVVTLGRYAVVPSSGVVMVVSYGTPAFQYAVDNNIEYRLRSYPINRITPKQTDIEVVYGKSAQLEFTLSPDVNYKWFLENPLVFTSSDESVATVSETGLVKSVAPGNAIIAIASKDDRFVNAAVNVTVVDLRGSYSKPIAFVGVSSGSNYARAIYGVDGGTAPFTITLKAGSETKTLKNVSGEGGQVSFVYNTSLPAETTKTIDYTVTVTDAAGYTSKATGRFKREYSSYKVGVGKPYGSHVEVGPDGNYHYVYDYESYKTIGGWHDTCIGGRGSSTQISYLSISDIGGHLGDSAPLDMIVMPDTMGHKVVFFSEDPAIASVEEDGTVTFNAPGQTTISAYTIDGSGLHATARASCLEKQVTVIELEPDAEVSSEDYTQRVIAHIEPDDADFKDLRWSTDDASIATIDQDGVLTWLEPGTVVVTATATDGSGVTTSIDVDWQGILVQKLTLQLDENDPKHLCWLVEPENASNPAVEFLVDDPTLMSIDPAGYMTFLNEGTATVRARALDGSGVTADLEVWTHNHTIVTEPGTPATCTADGLTDKLYCSSCGEVLQTAEIIPMTGHHYVAAGEASSVYYPGIACEYCDDILYPGMILDGKESITLPQALTEIEPEAFNANGSIQVVIAPDGLTAIGDRAFENCTELRLVMIGESLTQIGEDAFKGCDKLILVIEGENPCAVEYAEENEIYYILGE